MEDATWILWENSSAVLALAKKWPVQNMVSSLLSRLGDDGDNGDEDNGRISQSIQAPSSTHPQATYSVRTIPHSDIYIYIYRERERERSLIRLNEE